MDLWLDRVAIILAQSKRKPYATLSLALTNLSSQYFGFVPILFIWNCTGSKTNLDLSHFLSYKRRPGSPLCDTLPPPSLFFCVWLFRLSDAPLYSEPPSLSTHPPNHLTAPSFGCCSMSSPGESCILKICGYLLIITRDF